jgi:hypothetical protein
VARHRTHFFLFKAMAFRRAYAAPLLTIIALLATTAPLSFAKSPHASKANSEPKAQANAWSAVSARSANDLGIWQQGGTSQTAIAEPSATVAVNDRQNVWAANTAQTEQTCESGKGACIQRSAPTATASGTQTIDAQAANVVGIVQQGGGAGSQTVIADPSAATTVNAEQTIAAVNQSVTTQNCTRTHGACIQIAEPSATANGTQAIDASSWNTVGIEQTGSGGAQTAIVTPTATTEVAAQQNVLAANLATVNQHCTVERGACIQRVNPTATANGSQAIDAQAGNTVAVAQEGGSAQTTIVDPTATTNVNAQQNVAAINQPTINQTCDVEKGVCLQFIGKGRPTVIHGGR